MAALFMTKKHNAMHKNVFWIVSILTVVLLALYVLISEKITSFNASDIGLLSKLPTIFWIGLSLLAVLLFVCSKYDDRKIIFFILVVMIIIYIYFIPVLIRENKSESILISYWISSVGADIPSIGHLQFGTGYFWELTNWPGCFFISAFLSSITGLSPTFFSDYFPLLTILLLAGFAFAILRLRFNASIASLGSLFLVASLWTGQHYFSPQATAYVMYFAAFFLLLYSINYKKQNLPLASAILILFTATVATHLLTSFFVLGSMIAVYILTTKLRNKVSSLFSISMCILFATIFLSYQTIVIQQPFEGIVKALQYQLFNLDSPVAVAVQARAGGSASLSLQLASTYSISILIAVLAAIGLLTTFIDYFRHKKQTNDSFFWVAWILIAGLIGLTLVYGAEAINRAFMFMLLPSSYFALKFLGKKPIALVSLVVVLIFLFIPALYSSQNYVYVPTTELHGTSFYAEYASPNATFFYEPICPFLPVGLNDGSMIISLTLVTGLRSIPNEQLANARINEAQFILSSSLLNNYYVYFYGINPIENMSKNRYSQLYDNGEFQILNNH
jgi:hypothetical protein